MLYVILTIAGCIVLRWLVDQIVAWREGSAILECVESRNHAYTTEMIRRFGAVYMHEFATAHRSTPKEGYPPDSHKTNQG